MTSTGTTRICGVRTVAVPVTDQERALAFYVGTLGFAVRLDAAFGDGRWIEVAPEGATTTPVLVRRGPGTSAGVDTGIRLHTMDAGADVDPEVLRYPGVPPMFGFGDPGGNRLYVVERA
jgi:catechol 2,3-dioxygenase-like lactoylglutathione lyase family enzyme